MLISGELYSQYQYTPDIDGQELIDRLWEICSQHFRWDSILTIITYLPEELFIEGYICNMAWSSEDAFYTRMAIHLFGFKLIPYARYRRDNPPQGNWDKGWYNFPSRVSLRYKEVCTLLLDASERELLRD
jgi:hypothetical protein